MIDDGGEEVEFDSEDEYEEGDFEDDGFLEDEDEGEGVCQCSQAEHQQ